MHFQSTDFVYHASYRSGTTSTKNRDRKVSNTANSREKRGEEGGRNRRDERKGKNRSDCEVRTVKWREEDEEESGKEGSKAARADVQEENIFEAKNAHAHE